MRKKCTYLFLLTYNLYYCYILLKILLFMVTLCARSVIRMVCVCFFHNSEAMYGDVYCVYKNYLYHPSELIISLLGTLITLMLTYDSGQSTEIQYPTDQKARTISMCAPPSVENTMQIAF